MSGESDTNEPAESLSTLQSLIQALRSWRTASVVLLSFSSGLPLGLVWYSIPDWMRDVGVDIRIVGLFTLAQAPWAFKVLWSPLMDRYVPPFWGRRRGWAAVTQLALCAFGLLLAGVGDEPDAIWVVGALALAIAMAAASQDIAVDAYAVEVLRKEEQGAAVGARIALYRAAMVVAGGGAITLASELGWAAVNVLLAVLYLPMLLITWKAPEPEERTIAPTSLRAAVWLPFLGFLSRHRALEILAFVFFYKFADQLAQSLTRPFLIDMGYDSYHRGLALATVGMVATIGGAFLGGWVDDVDWARSLPVALRGASDILQHRVLPPRRHGRRCSRNVCRNELRALYQRHGDGGVLGPAASHDPEAFFGDAIRAFLEPVRLASSTGRTGQRLHRRCHGVAKLFSSYLCDGSPGDGAPRAVRPTRCA